MFSPENGSEVFVGKLEHSVAIRACPGENCSGDAAVIRKMNDTTLLVAIVDVTGHGYEASKTAARIERFFNKCRSGDAGRIMHRLNDTIVGTQGAAVGLCLIDTQQGSLEYAGIGNTVFRRFGEHDTRLVSRDGIVGVNMRAPKIQNLALENRDLVLMYTDGISDKFRFDPHSGTQHQRTSVIANKLIGEFGKGYDDAGCIALRYRDHCDD